MTPRRLPLCAQHLTWLPLRERFETIFRQTLQDWELFAYNSRPMNDAWESMQVCRTWLGERAACVPPKGRKLQRMTKDGSLPSYCDATARPSKRDVSILQQGHFVHRLQQLIPEVRSAILSCVNPVSAPRLC